jgi:hypothetical protein
MLPAVRNPVVCNCHNCVAHPKTMKAADGGPDWTWDPVRKDWWRKVGVVPAAAEVRTPPAGVSFVVPGLAPAPPAPFISPPPAFFRPAPMMMRGGGGGGRGRSC